VPSDPRITEFVILGTAWVLSIGLHEAGHAYTAHWLGDPTPELHGRLTLNPFAHLKPINTAVLLPLFFLAVGGGILGAASTPIDPSRFRKPLRDRLLVAAAGPAVNLLLAGAFIGIFLLLGERAPRGSLNHTFLFAMVHLNLVLFLFNMVPIPPLDGGDVFRYFLGVRGREVLDGMRQYGIIVAIILLNIPKVAAVYFMPAYLLEGLVF